MSTPRNILAEFIEQGIISIDKIQLALTTTKITPDGKSWGKFIDRLLLYIGGLALAFAVMFFIAYNWDDLGRFAKFGMVEGIIILSIIAYCWLEKKSGVSKVPLLFASICVGVLLALYGQTYQTGADPWQLFFTWALFILPWAIIGRFPALLILWVALINISIVLYYQTFHEIFDLMTVSGTSMLWLLFILNTLILLTWEFLAIKLQWLSERWAIRLLALGSGVSLTWLVMASIFEQQGTILPIPVLILWLIVMYYIYRKKKHDLFMLAESCMSVITVVVSFLCKHLLENSDEGGFLLIASLVIGMGSGTAFWLKKVHKEFIHE